MITRSGSVTPNMSIIETMPRSAQRAMNRSRVFGRRAANHRRGRGAGFVDQWPLRPARRPPSDVRHHVIRPSLADLANAGDPSRLMKGVPASTRMRWLARWWAGLADQGYVIVEGDLQVARFLVEGLAHSRLSPSRELRMRPRSEGRNRTIFSDGSAAISRMVCRVRQMQRALALGQVLGRPA